MIGTVSLVWGGLLLVSAFKEVGVFTTLCNGSR